MRAIGSVPDEPTAASVWQCVAGSTIDDHLLEWAEDRRGPIPDPLARKWKILRDAIDSLFTDLSQGRDWRLCSALLRLHSIADETCAGLGVALDASHGSAGSPASPSIGPCLEV
jgi:hypothetical protein